MYTYNWVICSFTDNNDPSLLPASSHRYEMPSNIDVNHPSVSSYAFHLHARGGQISNYLKNVDIERRHY